MSLSQIYQEILFLLPDQPESLIEKTIIFLHAINTKEGMKNNGTLESDQDQEWVGIAQNWNKPINGIYSLRYKCNNGLYVLFKFQQVQSSTISIEAKNAQSKNNYILKFDMCLLSFGSDELTSSNVICLYKKEILLNLFNEQKSYDQSQLSDEQKQQQQQQQQQQQDRYQYPPLEPSTNPTGFLWEKPRNQPFIPQCGQGDLDPFANLKKPAIGGMLIGPEQFNNFIQQNQQQRQPPFMPPPGARFDPYGPEPDLNPFPDTNSKGKKPWPPNQFGTGGGQFPF